MAEFEQIYSEKKRIALIRKEKKRLQEVLSEIPSDHLKIAEKLIDDAAFMAATLDETKKIINRDGIVETYQNGENQKGVKKSSAVEVYDKMVNTYTKVVKQLCDMLPEGTNEGDPTEELLKFTLGGKR